MQKDETGTWNHHSPRGICQFQRGSWETECPGTVFKFNERYIKSARSGEALVNTLHFGERLQRLPLRNKGNSEERY